MGLGWRRQGQRCESGECIPPQGAAIAGKASVQVDSAVQCYTYHSMPILLHSQYERNCKGSEPIITACRGSRDSEVDGLVK